MFNGKYGFFLFMIQNLIVKLNILTHVNYLFLSQTDYVNMIELRLNI